MKRYPVYRSKSAHVSQQLGTVALPVAIIAVLVHRFDLIDTTALVLSVLAGALLGSLAILLSLFSFARLWSLGGDGGTRALFGFVYGALALVPLALFASRLAAAPGMADVSTDLLDPPQFIAGLRNVEKAPPETLKVLFELPSSAQQKDLYPDIVPRRYRIAPGQLHAAAREVALRNDWRVSFELPPDLLDAPTGLQVETATRLLGLKEDMVVRIRPDPVGALLDVRSASRFGVRGLTGNVDRVRSFFVEIDNVLRETYGRLEGISVSEEDVLASEQSEDAADGNIVGEAAQAVEERETIPVPAFKPYFEEDDGPVAVEPADAALNRE